MGANESVDSMSIIEKEPIPANLRAEIRKIELARYKRIVKEVKFNSKKLI